MKKTLEYYLSLNYSVLLNQTDNGSFVAEIPSLPGCITQGDSMREATSLIEEAKARWLEMAIKNGIDIREPRQRSEYSGRFLVRMPRSLHARLTQQAADEGVSLNQYVVSLLSEMASNIYC